MFLDSKPPYALLPAKISLQVRMEVFLDGRVPHMVYPLLTSLWMTLLQPFAVSNLGTVSYEDDVASVIDIDTEDYSPDDDTREQRKHLFDTDSFTQKVCKCVSTTVADVMVLALAYASRHQPTKAALLDLLILINTVLQSNIMPVSKYLFRKAFPQQVSHHLYCPRCSFHLGRKTSTNCKRMKCSS